MRAAASIGRNGEGGGTAWQAAQILGVGATLVLVVSLLVVPATALTVLWDVAIPLLPASFLIAPALWRNVCPLATLNMATNRLGGRRIPTAESMPAARITGIALLVLLVPARRFLFNVDGTALAVVITLVALAALGLGAAFAMKAGFCNTICPVLPVERLYGQSPLLTVGNPRCRPCTSCTARGCLDLSPRKSVLQILGRSRRSHAWLQSDYGVFAAAFPGFVVGYNLTQDGPLATAGTVYLTVLGSALVSWVLAQLVVRALRLEMAASMRLFAASAIALYYWFAAPSLTEALRLAAWAPAAIRGSAFLLVVIWVWHAVRTSPELAANGNAAAA